MEEVRREKKKGVQGDLKIEKKGVGRGGGGGVQWLQKRCRVKENV